MGFLCYANSDIGTSKNVNQDSFLLKKTVTQSGEAVLSVICDGMGGLSHGEVASREIVKLFSVWFENDFPQIACAGITDSLIRNYWADIVDRGNEAIKKYAKQKNIKCGTTLNAVLITEQRYYCINVGDSRLYTISSDCIEQKSVDQTLVQREVELGRLTPEQAKTDPRRSVLTQCIGCADYISYQMIFGETKRNTVFLQCSDGFRHLLTENELLCALNPEILNNTSLIANNTDLLIKINMKRGEKDNITALVVKAY